MWGSYSCSTIGEIRKSFPFVILEKQTVKEAVESQGEKERIPKIRITLKAQEHPIHLARFPCTKRWFKRRKQIMDRSGMGLGVDCITPGGDVYVAICVAILVAQQQCKWHRTFVLYRRIMNLHVTLKEALLPSLGHRSWKPVEVVKKIFHWRNRLRKCFLVKTSIHVNIFLKTWLRVVDDGCRVQRIKKALCWLICFVKTRLGLENKDTNMNLYQQFHCQEIRQCWCSCQ